MWDKMVENDKVFCQNFMFFRRYLAPTQWAVGDCPPLKESPGRGPAARRNFFQIIGQN